MKLCFIVICCHVYWPLGGLSCNDRSSLCLPNVVCNGDSYWLSDQVFLQLSGITMRKLVIFIIF